MVRKGDDPGCGRNRAYLAHSRRREPIYIEHSHIRQLSRQDMHQRMAPRIEQN
jgi:hypothetical protein